MIIIIFSVQLIYNYTNYMDEYMNIIVTLIIFSFNFCALFIFLVIFPLQSNNHTQQKKKKTIGYLKEIESQLEVASCRSTWS